MSHTPMTEAVMAEAAGGIETGLPALDGLIEKARVVAQEEATGGIGAFSLFGLFEREDVPGLWDVLASHWRLKAGREAYLFIAERLIPRLTQQEALLVGRIVVLDVGDQFVLWTNRMFPGEAQTRELPPGVYNGVPLNRAFIFASERQPPVMQEVA